jgi:exodeoxyribonuclease-5
MLNQEQEQIKKEIIAAKNSKEIHIINGRPGTGKSFLASSIIKDIGSSSILVTAPTHEALNVLKEKLKLDKADNADNVDFLTVHAALQLKRVINNYTGEITFKKDEFSNRKDGLYHGGYDIWFIDEGSMLEKRIVEIIKTIKNVTIIILGDAAQINPVGEGVSPVFTSGFKEYTLTTPQRQSADNPILELSQNLDLISKKIPRLVGTKGYIFEDNLDKLVTKIANRQEKNDMVFLGWTNENVNAINKLVRQKIYKDPKRFQLGETVILDKPYKKFHNKQRIDIKDIFETYREFNIPTETSIVSRQIKLKVYDINNGDIIVLHEESVMEYYKISEEIKAKCVAGDMQWKLYYAFIDQVASLKHSYATSTHMSQGSTYFCAIVDVNNIRRNQNKAEAERLLYTAISRPSNILILYNA